MAKKKRAPTMESAVKRDLFSGLYGKKIQRDKTKYHRATMKRMGKESFAKIIGKVVFAKDSFSSAEGLSLSDCT